MDGWMGLDNKDMELCTLDIKKEFEIKGNKDFTFYMTLGLVIGG